MTYLLDLLRRNKARTGIYATETQDRLLEALRPFAVRDDIRAGLAADGESAP